MGENVKNIVIVGAGVTGLTTALTLARNHRYHITVCAKHMPGDYDIEYASPWAGANYMPVSMPGSEAAEWDRNTWPPLNDLANNHPEAGVHYQTVKLLNRKKDASTITGKWFAHLNSPNPWFKDLFPDFRIWEPSELGPGIDSATSFTSVCINTAIYLPWLVSQLLAKGVMFRRASFSHVADAASAHASGRPADVVINCTGLSARDLGGVNDKSVVPARGQIVVVRNMSDAMYGISGTDDAEDEVCYIMTRAAGGGTVLGGSYQKGNWSADIDEELSLRIMKRCLQACPSLVPEGKGIEALDIVRRGVGLRPLREGGPRIEKEKIRTIWVVHNYGHGGYGYQSSYGCAQVAARLVEDCLEPKARL